MKRKFRVSALIAIAMILGGISLQSSAAEGGSWMYYKPVGDNWYEVYICDAGGCSDTGTRILSMPQGV